jgi:hypothetical protein
MLDVSLCKEYHDEPGGTEQTEDPGYEVLELVHGFDPQVEGIIDLFPGEVGPEDLVYDVLAVNGHGL